MISLLIILIGLLSGCTSPGTNPKNELTVLGVNGVSKEFTLAELKDLTNISGTSEYQNSYGNYKDKGIYRGVPISIFAESVGGIQKGDILVVTSEDNYTQIYPYENIFPSTSWEAIQGTMILAYEFNGTKIPDWNAGLRIAFIPADGQYSNIDSTNTSSLESIESSGSRKWSKYVVKLEFKRENATITFGYDSTNYSLSWSQVLQLPSINESGISINKENVTSDPYHYTGVNLTYILDLFIDTTLNFSIDVVVSDGYTRTFLREQFFGNTTLFDSSGNEVGQGSPENVSLILAYYQGNQELDSEDGSFKSVYVGPYSPITGSKYWVRDVVYIQINVV